jgi:hypothetical protein
VKAGWIVASAVDGAAVVIGHLPAGLRPGGWASCQVPANERKPTVGELSRSHHVTAHRKQCRYRPPRNTLQTAYLLLFGAQALAPRRAQIRRIWRVGACDHLCTATVVTLVFLTGIDGAGARSRRPDHPRRLVAAVPVGLGSPPQVSGGVIPGGLSQLLGSGCPSGLLPAAGCPKSSTSAARRKITPGSRRSAGR